MLKATSRAEVSRGFLTLQNATFRFGDELVFRDTTWKFDSNQHWAVLGGNGSGKTLFAECLRGRLPLVDGSMDYLFRPPVALSPEESLGYVSFEDRKLNLQTSFMQSRWSSFEDESLTVGEFLQFERVMGINPFSVEQPYECHRRGFQKRLRRSLQMLELEGLRERVLVTLSNGERQRVQLAHELSKPLRLLILDEPFTGVDVATRTCLRGFLENAMKTRLRLVIITTHLEDLPPGITHCLRIQARKIGAVMPFDRTRVGDGKGKVRSRQPQKGRNRLNRKPGPVVVTFRNVSVNYGGRSVLHNLTWTVREGESWAILGPNGSGKTTMLSLISGDHPQVFSNHIQVFGKLRGSGESIWEIKQQIGIVSPELHLHFDDALTCHQAVLSGFFDTNGLYEEAVPGQKTAALRWLEKFHLQHRTQTPLNCLSFGEQRMVLLARALVKEPKLLILDEPCQGLDEANRRSFLKTISELLRKGGSTILFVTHRAEETPREITRTLSLGQQTCWKPVIPQAKFSTACRS